MRTIVYIDGFNLFYGLLRNTPWLWLDLEKFVRSLLTEKYDIVAIKFFAARIHSDKFMQTSPHDQACYFEALMANPLIQIVEGVYKRFRVKLPFVKEPCVSCGKVEYATVWKTEENAPNFANCRLSIRQFLAIFPRSVSCRMKSRSVIV